MKFGKLFGRGNDDESHDEELDGMTYDSFDDECDEDCIYERSGNYCPECHRGD